MKQLYQSYLQIIRDACTSTSSDLSLSTEDERELVALAQRHFTASFVLPYIKDTGCIQNLKFQIKQMLLNYYQIEQFTRKIIHLMDQHSIPCYLLKGVGLCSCYPMPEDRKLGDVDLYINDPRALEQAKSALKQNGFIPLDEISDHHLTYQYTFSKTGRTCLLELHFRVIGFYQYDPANRVVDQVFSPEHLHPETLTVRDFTVHVLPPTECAFYQLHHMLKHYLYTGFGIRLLCDFTFYLNIHYREIDFSLIHRWCRDSRILHFYEIVLSCCKRYLGLAQSIDPETEYPEADCEEFILRILEEKDMGTEIPGTLVGSGSYQKVNLLTYFKEGHLQMHVRFPKLGKYPLLWPFLWGITLFCFLKNTYFLRRTTLKDTLSSFKQTNEKSQLIRIFDNSDS